MITILGAGLAGLSCSFHLGHGQCRIYEANPYPGGHVYSSAKDGCIWDQGPHVSFTKNNYVRDLFEKNVCGEYSSYKVKVGNYFCGAWIPHPAQVNLFAVPEPLRSECLAGFMARAKCLVNEGDSIANYEDWLFSAFGDVFTEKFSAVYTQKYWTVPPRQLTTDWVGGRVLRPELDAVVQGCNGQSGGGAHYIQEVRYPSMGGYFSYAKGFISGADIQTGYEATAIDLERQEIKFANGKKQNYEKLINTIPLPDFVRLCSPPAHVRSAADMLTCTSLLLVNVVADHPTTKPYHWMYVYDENMLSTRINCVELISPSSVPAGKTALQVEVYASRYKSFTYSHGEIAEIVCRELIAMGFITAVESCHTQYVPYANVVFDHYRRGSLNCIFEWLSGYGLVRESDDLEPMTDWGNGGSFTAGKLALAGRFGQWKYFWSDDCVLRGRQLAAAFKENA